MGKRSCCSGSSLASPSSSISRAGAITAATAPISICTRLRRRGAAERSAAIFGNGLAFAPARVIRGAELGPARMPRLHFEDFRPGAADIPGAIAATEDETVAFAREFDAQPFHPDEDAAKRSFAGGLIASGWQSCGFLMRLIADGFINESSPTGPPGG